MRIIAGLIAHVDDPKVDDRSAGRTERSTPIGDQGGRPLRRSY